MPNKFFIFDLHNFILSLSSLLVWIYLQGKLLGNFSIELNIINGALLLFSFVNGIYFLFRNSSDYKPLDIKKVYYTENNSYNKKIMYKDLFLCGFVSFIILVAPLFICLFIESCLLCYLIYLVFFIFNWQCIVIYKYCNIDNRCIMCSCFNRYGWN